MSDFAWNWFHGMVGVCNKKGVPTEDVEDNQDQKVDIGQVGHWGMSHG